MTTGSLLTRAMLAKLRSVYDSALGDDALHLEYPDSPPTGTYGYARPTYLDNNHHVACLFRPSSKGGVIGGFGAGSNELLGSAQVQTSDAVLFIPRDVFISALDRFKLVSVQGETLVSPITFEIVGGPVLDQVEHRVTVRQVNDGSEG